MATNAEAQASTVTATAATVRPPAPVAGPVGTGGVAVRVTNGL
jgi:hypothetical protein